MLEAARGWLTPPVLFVLVNLVIATIAVASRLMSPGPAGADDEAAAGGGRRAAAALLRAPSLAVDRLRASLSFSRLAAADHAPPLFDYPAPAAEPPALHHHQPQEERTAGAGAAGNGAEEEVELEHRREEEEARVERSRSEAAAELALGSGPRPRARRTRRAAAPEPAVAHDAVAVAHRAAAGRGDEPAAEVDARADDFIQRFREQLRLQRLDSILRYRDTLRRTGTA